MIRSFVAFIALIASGHAHAYTKSVSSSREVYSYTADDIRDNVLIHHQFGNYTVAGALDAASLWSNTPVADPSVAGHPGCLLFGPYVDFIGHGTIRAEVDLWYVYLAKPITPVAPGFRSDLVSNAATNVLDYKDFWQIQSQPNNPNSHDVVIDGVQNYKIELEAANVGDEKGVEVRICNLTLHSYAWIRSVQLELLHD